MTELVGNNIKYDYALGRGGGRFFLFPLEGYHTEDDVKKAKAEIRRDHDVLSINTERLEWDKWKDLPVWFEIGLEKNKKSNVEFHKQIYGEYSKSINPGSDESKSNKEE